MGMQTCAACGGACRRTVIAIVIGGDKPERARVCKQCERRGTFIVPVTRAIVNDTTKAERADQRAVLEPFIKRLEGLAHAKRTQLARMAPSGAVVDMATVAGAAETYEAIAHMLREGRT